MPRKGKIASLPEEILAAVRSALTENRPVAELAEWLHSLGLCTEVRIDNLGELIQRYKVDVMNVEAAQRMAVLTAHDGTGTMKIMARMDALTELIELAEIQKARVQKGLAIEAKMPMPLKQVSRDVELLAGTLVNIAKLHLETGILPRARRGEISAEQREEKTEDGRKVTRVLRIAVTDESGQLIHKIDQNLAKLT